MKREIRDKNDTGITVTMEQLSNKRQSFCRYIVNGYNPTEAYIKSFNVTSERKHTATEASSRLMRLATIQQHIDTLQAGISDKLASEIVFDKRRIISELALNMELGRETKQLAASNQAINLIGKAVGNVFEADSVTVSGTVSMLHSLSDEVLEQLASMVTEPVSIDDSEAIEASYKLLESEAD